MELVDEMRDIVDTVAENWQGLGLDFEEDVQTDIEQMNRLVERINWSAGSYWGEPGKMRFKTNIESYTDSTELADRDRIVKFSQLKLPAGEEL